jgi:hypothetical protein
VDDKPLALVPEEVISVEKQNLIIFEHPMFTQSQLLSAIKYQLYHSANTNAGTLGKWLSEGVGAKVLQFGAKSWRKGKVKLKISLEFYPENPEPEETTASNETDANPSESSLDDLRQKINQETQSQN